MYRILYVDDEPGLLEIGKLFLEKGGQFSVDIQTSASAALMLLSSTHYDAIIADYQMPVMDGIEFLKKVRKSGSTIPFILFTGRGREEVVIQALNEGADFYLQKGGQPLAQFTELAHHVRQAIQQRRAEASIRDHERREADIINFLPDATFAIDSHGVVIAWNLAMEKLTGVPAEQILGKGNYEYAHSLYHKRRPVLVDLVLSDNPDIEARYPHITRAGKTLFSEITVPHMNNGRGATMWFTASPLYNTRGEIVGAIESIRDITERKKAEAGLRESEERYRKLVEQSPDAIIVHTNGRVAYANLACTRLLGAQSPKELAGQPILNFVHPDFRHIVLERIRVMTEKTEPVEILEEKFLRLDGTVVDVEVAAIPIIFENESSVQVTFREITSRKRAEDALRQANRKLNLLTGITRHDIDNQITTLLGFLHILEKKLPDPALIEYFQKISMTAKRISAMIRFTKEYEKIGVHVPLWQDTRMIVRTAEKESPLGNVMVKNDLPTGTEVFADPLIVKVFYNLMDNAVRYGGKITTIRFTAQESGDDHLILCEDDGEGISAEEKERIFDRGYGKNTGMGLFLAREILSITGITIRETGEPGKGARFEIAVPKGAYRVVDIQQKIITE
jgi:PAS domain S-box-containing protein